MTVRLALATSNEGKRTELIQLFQAFDVVFERPSTRTLAAIEETGTTFIENALLKARAVCATTALPAIADDSGLMVNALGGLPGVHSARYAGEPSNDQRNNQKLLNAMRGVPDAERAASFVCALIVIRRPDDPAPILGYGTWRGEILHAPRGLQGFGYDPLFYLPSLGLSAAELSVSDKNKLSHRARAGAQIVNRLHNENFLPSGSSTITF